MPSRSSVSFTQPPSPRFRVSAMGRAAIAASWARAAARTEATRRGVMHGRTPSWTAIHRTDAGTTPSPRATDSWRSVPPATTARSFRHPRSRRRHATTSSGGTATTTPATWGVASSTSSVHRRIGRPNTGSPCFFEPIRTPRPPAGTTTQAGSRPGRGPGERGMRARGRILAAARGLLLGQPGEDHPPGRGLEHRVHRHADALADGPPALVDHDHRAVLEVGHALPRLLPLAKDVDVEDLAGKNDGTQGARQLVDVEDPDPVQLGHLVQVVIVRNDDPVHRPRRLDEAPVHFPDLGEVQVVELRLDPGHSPETLEHVEPAAAAVALERVAGVGDLLELAEDVLGDEQRALEKPGLADVSDAPVDDHARVEHLVAGRAAAVRVGEHHPGQP